MANAFDREEQVGNKNAKIIAAVERISTVFRASLWDDAKQHKLTPLQTQIILFIAFHESAMCSVTQLAEEFSVTKATTSDAVKALIEKQLVRKCESEDARGFTLALTAAGKKICNKLTGVTAFFDNVLEKLPQHNIDTILEGLLLLMQVMQQTGTIPLRMCFSCKHYEKNSNSGDEHYCSLLRQKLMIEDIRVDCPEHLKAD